MGVLALEDVKLCVFMDSPSVDTVKYLAVKREELRVELERDVTQDPLLTDKIEANVDLVCSPPLLK